jgi:hypothetical protein
VVRSGAIFSTTSIAVSVSSNVQSGTHQCSRLRQSRFNFNHLLNNDEMHLGDSTFPFLRNFLTLREKSVGWKFRSTRPIWTTMTWTSSWQGRLPAVHSLRRVLHVVVFGDKCEFQKWNDYPNSIYTSTSIRIQDISNNATTERERQ